MEKEHQSQKNELKTKGANPTLSIILGVIIAFVIIWIIISYNSETNTNPDTNTPSQKTCNDVQVPYQDTEQYTDQEPYQDTETYMTYLKSQVISANSMENINIGLGVYAYAQVQLKNIDNQAEWFTVTFNWQRFNANWQEAVRHYIAPDQTIQFESTYDIDAGEKWSNSYSYTSDPIQNTRQVTKYRDVTKTREVIKYRTEQQCN